MSTPIRVEPLAYYLCYPEKCFLPFVDEQGTPRDGDLGYAPQARYSTMLFSDLSWAKLTDAEMQMAMLIYLGQTFAMNYCQDIDVVLPSPVAGVGYGEIEIVYGIPT